MTDTVLMIFSRRPELGKVKTRLAASIGDEKALEVYRILLQHTFDITHALNCDKQVWYSTDVPENDLWSEGIFTRYAQQGRDIGERMKHAFEHAFHSGYSHVMIIGSDLYDIGVQDIEQALDMLYRYETVIGPAQDGGYYLLGMNSMIPNIFENKDWGSNTVLEASLADLSDINFRMLSVRNDVDVLEDIIEIDFFRKILNDVDRKTT